MTATFPVMVLEGNAAKGGDVVPYHFYPDHPLASHRQRARQGTRESTSACYGVGPLTEKSGIA